MRHHQQFAAIPWIILPEGLRFLLISSRDTGRWVIPKGWAEAGLEGWEVAEMEAFEEAGVAGDIDRTPLGTYTYKKKLHFFSRIRCRVEVYGLQVTEQRRKWPEARQRRLNWVQPEVASESVAEPELAEILMAFERRVRNRNVVHPS